jgi:predicted O-methyltransferase YrrM
MPSAGPERKRVYPTSYTGGVPDALCPAADPATEEELAIADGIRSRFLFPGDAKPYMVDIVRAMRLLRGKRRYVEVGTYDRGCLAYVSTLLARGALLVDVDIEPRPEHTEKLQRFLQAEQRLVTVVGDSSSQAVLHEVRAALGDEGADAVFIDGNHSAESAWADYANFLNVLAPGGLMFFHDVYWRGTEESFGVSAAMEWIDRVHPVYVVFIDHPLHRFFPSLRKGDEVWGGVGIIKP